ncbi:MAG TPA: Maf family protein, partial [Terriglobia bacterium]|nr:Maf family protein [Terriglobia bacterium]
MTPDPAPKAGPADPCGPAQRPEPCRPEPCASLAPRLILASASPRRRDLLRAAGFEFDVRPSAVAEVRRPGEPGEEFAARAARDKALDVAR